MFAQLSLWYKSLSSLKQFMLSFFLNWIFWLAAWLVGERIFFDEQMSWAYHIFHATWMTFFTTVFSNWRKIKALFKNG